MMLDLYCKIVGRCEWCRVRLPLTSRIDDSGDWEVGRGRMVSHPNKSMIPTGRCIRRQRRRLAETARASPLQAGICRSEASV